MGSSDAYLAIVGATIGKCSILKPPYNDNIILTENCAKIRIRKEAVFPDYLFILLQTKFVQKQIQLNYIQTTLPKLGLDRVLSLRFPPIPSKNQQQDIIDRFNNGLKSKHQKEIQAKQLLESIDEYLLNELGITLPEKDNSLQNRVFTTSLSNVSGGRFDPFYFLYCIENPKSTLHDEVILKEVAAIVKGQSITSDDIIEGDYPVIAGGQTSPYSHNQYNHFGNVITISASGAYSGYAWYHKTPIFASDCSVVKSKNESICNTEFLFNVLKLKQNELYNLQQGSGQPHVYPSDIYKIGIPLPKIDKQLEINTHVLQIREQVKQLQMEAVEELENAKKEVEAIILGS